MTVTDALTRAYHEEWARVVAALARRFSSLDIAEDAAAEAFARAASRWPVSGVPPNPGGWLTTTATRFALDQVRRESQRGPKEQEAVMTYDDSPPQPTGPVVDDRLRLIFTCCHPALAMPAQVALTLRLLGGLTVGEIAAAFLVPETTMAQRITRAKAKIKKAHIPYVVPTNLSERLDGVLAVVYLIFNEGYLSSGGEAALRSDLSDEAIRLGRLLHALLPASGEVTGLLALMLLTDSRRAARVSAASLVTLSEQDRSLWSRPMIDEGTSLVRSLLAAVAAGGPPPGRYQLMAAMAAVHANAPSSSSTDWSQIVTLYDRLLRLEPSPIVALNRAVAVAELDGPAVGLALVDELRLDGYHAFHATRADLLRRLGRSSEAVAAYERAIALAPNPAERAYLSRRRDEVAVSGSR
ncbi:DUF6596 domain-containing protein [Branchiibius sp. NY16-3462-2]|uniref:RNA polymerase sigma factor n=1 Tax=Branchiibius sp. NY16-3462-2 TaxID=1807500 RepID=UPI00079B82AF|nr:DUF6596 domain-containing protein [Branchiibius sp. NY16-3462-2]KYH43404.1 RNA polymerase subunit sigma-24 [Branchiibius sp. NY16-3462-2]